MRSPAAQLLETALALQRAPGERFRLRERPLPPGLVHLLEIAAASPQALEAAATELGEPEPVLVEAARFYLEQVLFADPDADAYRVLGLSPDATHDAVRLHHRWLQRWLHPDRAQAGDASVFATRVNQAFAQLRTPEARHAYDVRLAEARLAGASAPLPADTVRHWEHAEVEAPRHGRRSRWLLAAALVACVVLAVLIVRNPERAAPWEPGDGFDVASLEGESAGHDAPAIEDRDLGILGDALSRPRAAEPVGPDPAPAPVQVAEAELPAAAVVPATVPAAPVAAAAPPVPAPAADVTRASKPAPPTPDWRNVASNAETVPAAPRSAPAPAVRQASVAAGPTAVQAAAAATEAAIAAATPENPAPAPATEATAPAASAAPPAPSPAAPPLDGAVALARMRQAEQRVAEVAGFLAAKPGAVPLWNDPRVLAEATRLRTQLNARKGSRLDLGRPSWRLSAERARISAPYRCRSAASAPCEGTLGIDLVWREGMWLVRDVDLGPPS